ncbi:MAG: efflux RND transporter periplasmic adaptor subunit, partial [Paucibacter sp.]|nr:efflux RND transporter periplasmic adaptor subunit [Roseateles sp.]
PALIEFSGPLVAPNTAIVHSKVAGTLLSLNVGEGSRVSMGQSLGNVDLEDLHLRLAERQANVAATRAQFEQAEKVYKTNEGLAAQNFIAATALDSSRASMEAARGAWLAAKAQAENGQVSLRLASLTSPLNGIVAKRFAVPGEKLALEQQILSIVDLSRLELAGLVGTHEVSRLKPGMAVEVQVEGVDKPVTAHIARISPIAEPGTRSITVTLALENPGEQFRAGQYAVAKLLLPDETERLTVPDSAISSTGGQSQVWLIEQGGLTRRIVTLGRKDARQGLVEVLQGLNPQAQVLALRFDNLKEGAKAQILADKPARPATVASMSATAASN